MLGRLKRSAIGGGNAASSNEGGGETPARRRTTRKILLLLVLPSILSSVLQAFVPLWAAYLISSVPVLYVLGRTYWESRKPDFMAILMLISILASTLIAIFTQNHQYVNLANCVVPLLLIIAFLGSFLLKENLISIAHRQMHPGSDEWKAYHDRCWTRPGFRHTTIIITVVWSAGFLVQIGILVAVDFLALDAFKYVNIGIGIIIPVALGFFTYWFIGHRKKVLTSRGVELEEPPVITQ